MVKKLNLVSNIEKYYLNGNIESVKWVVSDKKLYIDFISPNQDLVGHIECDIDLEDDTLGIFNTNSLLKMLSILETDIIIKVEQKHKTATKLLIEDTNFSLQYSLADPDIISNVPSITEPEYDITFTINSEFISRFRKAKSALGSNTRNIFRVHTNVTSDGNKEVKFILGDATSHANKIEFSTDATFNNFLLETLTFNSEYVKEILNSNTDDWEEAIGYLSVQGLLKLEFKNGNGTSIYYLPSEPSANN